MLITGWIILLLVLLMASGCMNTFTTLYKVDLAAQRRLNAAEDLALLRPEYPPMDLPDPLTLDDAVHIGLENNLDMRISRIMAEINDDKALVEKLKMLPSASFRGNFSQSNVLSATDEDQIQKSATLTLSWNILDFGLSYIRARQTAIRTEIKRMERIRQAQNLASNIFTAYWKTVLAEQSLEELRKIEREIGEYKKKAEILVAEKRLDPIASKAIEKKIIELAITAENLQAEISGAKIQLVQLMGLNPMTPINLKREPFREYVERMPLPESLASEKLERISLHNRPEMFTADMDIQVQQDEAKAMLLSMFPGIGLAFSTNYNANSSYQNNFWFNWAASVTNSLLSIPGKYFNWEAQNKNLDMATLRRLMLSAGVIVQTHVALHDYRVKIRQFRLYEDSFSITKDLLNMSRERHQLGLLSSWALTQRMLEEVVARLGRDRRIIDLMNAYNTLLVTLGLDYSQWRQPLPDMDEEAMPDDIQYKDIVKRERKPVADEPRYIEPDYYYQLENESKDIEIESKDDYDLEIAPKDDYDIEIAPEDDYDIEIVPEDDYDIKDEPADEESLPDSEEDRIEEEDIYKDTPDSEPWDPFIMDHDDTAEIQMDQTDQLKPMVAPLTVP